MKIRKVKQIIDELSKYCIFAHKDDYIAVTEWSNGEGYDVDIGGRKDKQFSLTSGELEAMVFLTQTLEHGFNSEKNKDE
jgi:DMSO/TMAO reductase YedYZ molybdopterin-dependent catalytic subunit